MENVSTPATDKADHLEYLGRYAVDKFGISSTSPDCARKYRILPLLPNAAPLPPPIPGETGTGTGGVYCIRRSICSGTRTL